MGEKISVADFMSGYDARIYKGYKKTISDRLQDKRVFSNMLKSALLTDVPMTDEETGETVFIPVGMKLICEKLKYLNANPKDIDLKEISAVLGEAKLETETTLRGADELFGDIVNETK